MSNPTDPTPPLVIGVSGLMEFRDGDRDRLKAKVKSLLWRFVKHSPPDPGEPHMPWLKPIPHTPIVILSSFALFGQRGVEGHVL